MKKRIIPFVLVALTTAALTVSIPYLVTGYKTLNRYALKPLWVSALNRQLPELLCQKLPQGIFECAWTVSGSCIEVIQGHTEQCLRELNSKIPFFIEQPHEGQSLGGQVGGCVDTKLTALPPATTRSSAACQKLLVETGLATDDERLAYRFSEDVRSSKSMQVIETLQPGAMEQTIKRGIANRKFHIELELAKVESRKRYILTASEESILAFGTMRLEELESLCAQGDGNEAVKELVELVEGENGVPLDKLDTEDFAEDGRLKKLAKTIASSREARGDPQVKDSIIAAVIESGANSATSPPTDSEFQLTLQAAQNFLDEAAITRINEDPTSCDSLLHITRAGLKLDQPQATIFMKYVHSQ